MTIRVALEHVFVNDMLKRAEQENGAIAKYKIELKDDLQPIGFAPYPVGMVEAIRLKVEGVDSYLFFNAQDDYFRATVVPLDCAKVAELVAYETPYADKMRAEAETKLALETVAQTRRREAAERDQLEQQRQLAENNRSLEAVAKLAAHLGLDAPRQLSFAVRFTASKVLELEAVQGGKLNLDVLSVGKGQTVEVCSTKVNRSISQALYKHRYKHDVEFNLLPDDKMEIAFKDLKGAVLSRGVFSFHDTELTGRPYDDEDNAEVTYISQVIDHVETDEYAPSIFEKGRPVLLRDSAFKSAYLACNNIEFVEPEFEDLCPGPAAQKHETETLGFIARNILESNKESYKIAKSIRAKPAALEASTPGLG
ncbi:MAG: hypothetical protein RSD49_08385 [Hafnia sp.]